MPFDPHGTAYDLTGPEEAPVLVLIHGLGLNRSLTWNAMIPVLAQDYRVLAYDLLGHGDSEVPEGDVDLTRLGGQVIALMDALGVDKAALIGFSLGGMINRRIAVDYPDRVSCLAILNSPHERDPERQALAETHARQSGEGGPAATLEAALERWITPEFRRENKDIIDDIRGVILANDPINYTKHRFVLAAGVTELIRPEPPLTHPMLVMTCEHDSGSTPAMTHAIAAETEGARAIVVPDLRHMGLVEQPALFLRELLPFLRSATA